MDICRGDVFKCVFVTLNNMLCKTTKESPLKYIIFSFLAFLIGCTTTNVYKSEKDLEEGAVFIIGIEPEDFLVQFNSGSTDKGYFIEKFMGTYNSAGWPTDGYLVAKADPDVNIALTYMRYMKKDTPLGGQQYCARGNTPVFSVDKGDVVYITNVHYEFSENRLGVGYTDNFEDAQEFLKKHYPELSSKLKRPKDLKFMPASLSCGNIIVY